MRVLPESTPAPRLTLRRWVESDVDAFAEAIAESVEHLRPWMAWAANEPVDRDEHLARIRRWEQTWAEGGDVGIGAFLDGRVVGSGGLHWRAGPDTLEIGYWTRPSCTGLGYATELSAALTSAAFTVDGIDLVEIRHDKANIASQRIPERLGYEFVGEQPDEIGAPAEVGIDCRWAMTRDRWATLQAAMAEGEHA